MNRLPALLLLPALAVPLPAAGQQAGEPLRADPPQVCGDADQWQAIRRSLRSPSGREWQEEAGLLRVSPSDPQGPVEDPEVCRTLVEHVREEIGYPLDRPVTYGVHRFGDHYLVATVAVRHDDGEVTAWILHTWMVFAFRVDDLGYVTRTKLPAGPSL